MQHTVTCLSVRYISDISINIVFILIVIRYCKLHFTIIPYWIIFKLINLFSWLSLLLI